MKVIDRILKAQAEFLEQTGKLPNAIVIPTSEVGNFIEDVNSMYSIPSHLGFLCTVVGLEIYVNVGDDDEKIYGEVLHTDPMLRGKGWLSKIFGKKAK